MRFNWLFFVVIVQRTLLQHMAIFLFGGITEITGKCFSALTHGPFPSIFLHTICGGTLVPLQFCRVQTAVGIRVVSSALNSNYF